MRLKRLLISAAAVLGMSALGLSAHAAAPTASGAGHDQMAGKGKSTFTLIYRGGFRGGRIHGGGFRGGAIGYRGGFGRGYALAGRPGFYGGVRRAHWGGGRYWGGLGAGWYGGLGRPYGWGWRRAGWNGGWGWRRPAYSGIWRGAAWNGWRRAGWYGGWGWPVGVGLVGYGYGSGSCYWNCRAAGYGPRYCSVNSYAFCSGW